MINDDICFSINHLLSFTLISKLLSTAAVVVSDCDGSRAPPVSFIY